MRVNKNESLLNSMVSKVTAERLEYERAYKKMLSENLSLRNELEYSERIREDLEEELTQVRGKLFETQEKIIKLNIAKESNNKDEVDEYINWLNSEESNDLENAYREAYGDVDHTYDSKELNEAI